MTKITYKQKKEHEFIMRTEKSAPISSYNKLVDFVNLITTPRIAFQNFEKEIMSADKVIDKIQLAAIKLLQELRELK